MTITLQLSRERRPNADLYWRFSRYRVDDSDYSLCSNQIADCTMTHFKQISGQGIIIGTDHGKEIWNTPSSVICYDLETMMRVARANTSINGKSADFALLEEFKPQDCRWLKIVDNQKVYDLLLPHRSWASRIPTVFMHRNYANPTNINWGDIFGNPKNPRWIAKSAFLIYERGVDYG